MHVHAERLHQRHPRTPGAQATGRGLRYLAGVAPPTVTLLGVPGLPLVQAGDDVGALLVDAIRTNGIELAAGDAVVVTSKILSKAEGRAVDLRTIEAGAEAIGLAARTDKEPELVELVLRESTGVVRAVPGVLIVRHRLGFTSANAAIDRSNADGSEHTALLMPVDPDRSAARVRDTARRSRSASTSRSWSAIRTGAPGGAATSVSRSVWPGSRRSSTRRVRSICSGAS